MDRAFNQAALQISVAGLAEDRTPKLFVRDGVSAADIRFTGSRTKA